MSNELDGSSALDALGGRAARRRRSGASADSGSLLPLDLWLQGVELLRGVPDSLAGWLTENGLLTERIRAAGRGCRLRLLDQYVGFLTAEQRALLQVEPLTCFVREVELLSGDTPWIYAQTLVPDATLELHTWLSELGESPLGETLSGIREIARGPFEYATLPAVHPLAARALRDLPEEPDFVWARRSWVAIRGRRLLVQEVFLPALGQG